MNFATSPAAGQALPGRPGSTSTGERHESAEFSLAPSVFTDR